MTRTRLVTVLAALVGLTTAARGQEARPRPYDVVIRGGTIVDGTGNPWFEGDVGIRGDRIAAIGRLDDAPTNRTIDAHGLVVAPGFIDVHSHSDMLLLRDGDAQSKVHDGVTTEILGEDTSAGPRKGKVGARPAGNGTPAESAGSWTTLGGYFDALEARGISVNVASYVGLGTILECVQGNSLARPDRAGVEAMKVLLDEAMRDGALGLSTMLASPRELAVTTDDIVELAAVVRRHGGLYSTHLRNEGTEVLAAVAEAIEIGRRAGVPVDIIHLKIADQSLWHHMGEVIALIKQARREWVNVQTNVYPYTRGNNNLVTIIPPWAHEGGKDALIARLKDPQARERLKREIRSGLPGWYDHYTAVGGDWSRMLISAGLSPAHRKFEGQTMDRVITALSPPGSGAAPDPLDVFFDFLIAEGGSVGAIYAHHTEEDMNLALLQPWCSIGSDGSAMAVEGPLRAGHPHPRSFGTFSRVLGCYVRERRLLRLEDAIRKMTSLNASKVGIVDRGILRPGMFADVTIFDPEHVADRATYLDPFRYSVGIRYVLVNGQLVLNGEEHTHAHPGRALRHPRRSDPLSVPHHEAGVKDR
ncbi:MAG: N-acyl-D-amino-acid deacylase family protein [Isosphaeraceae bacterium]